MKSSHENFIKAVYHLSPSDTYLVSTSAIAESLSVSKSSSTEVVQELAAAGYIDYHKYQGVRLTKKGKRKALQIIRSHRLWEVFLVDKLGFNWDEVHDLAEELEHIRNGEFIDRLDAFLDHPKRDPHGDPIPTKDGKFSKRPLKQLSELKTGDIGILTRVVDDSEAFLNYLDKLNLRIGDQIEVCEIEAFDQSIYINSNGEEKQITAKAAVLLQLNKTK